MFMSIYHEISRKYRWCGFTRLRVNFLPEDRLRPIRWINILPPLVTLDPLVRRGIDLKDYTRRNSKVHGQACRIRGHPLVCCHRAGSDNARTRVGLWASLLLPSRKPTKDTVSTPRNRESPEKASKSRNQAFLALDSRAI